jgi:hypothetical protein
MVPVLTPDTAPGAMTQVVDAVVVDALPPLNVVMSTVNVIDAPAVDFGPAQ